MSESVLLPKGVRPTHYNLRLKPDFEAFKFSGSVTIDLEVTEPTNEIKFHADELEIHSAVLTANDTTTKAGENGVPLVTFDKEKSLAVVNLGDETLPSGSASLALEFSGTLNDNMVGFYRASYVQDGEKKWMATTQFEPVGARKSLPCWDEPAVKASFDVTLVVPPGLTGLSNMPVTSTVDLSDGWTEVTFATSPVMSTYLLAFVVGEVEKVSGATKDGKTEVNVYTTPGKKEQGRFALSVASKLISFFTDYFGIPYPLPKADLIGIPDFAAGAMENWGLITFRETALLVDAANASASTKQRVAYVVSHELAHQWFGNLVTMQWWSDLWLNEGFATWVGWLGVDHVYPEWDVWTQFVSTDMDNALATDALLGSHPVQVPINDPKEIEQVFDALSYRKGACVIRQLEAAIGSESFKKGLHHYLSTHKYANTVTDDLWSALGEASGKPVKAMMDSWTKQTGYPVVTVSLSGDEEAASAAVLDLSFSSSSSSSSSSTLHLRQSRFLSKGPPSPEEDEQLWWIPVTVLHGGENGVETSKFVLSEKSASVKGLPDNLGQNGGWLRLNGGQAGIFRVNYPPQLWAALSSSVEAQQLPLLDRLGTVMDAFALAKAGVIDTTLALGLAAAFKAERDYTVWNQLTGEFSELDSLLSSTPDFPLLQAFGQQLYAGVVEAVGWEAAPGESHLLSLLRPLVLGKLAHYGHEGTVAESKRQFGAMQADLSAVHPDLRRLVMAVSVKFGGRSEFEAVKKLYQEAKTPDFKIQCLTALGQSKDLELVKEFLDFGLDDANVKTQDQLYVFASAAGNLAGREFAWGYFKDHWESIYSRFLPAPGIFKYIPALPLRGFSSEAIAEDAEEFFAANPVPEASMELGRTLEGIRSRAAWLKRDGGKISEWLKAQA